MSLARDVTTVGSATLLSRLIGFFRDVGIAAVLGAGVLSDAFFAALQIPNNRDQWVSTTAGASGTITLSTLTATGATGTFSLTLVPLPGVNAIRALR